MTEWEWKVEAERTENVTMIWTRVSLSLWSRMLGKRAQEFTSWQKLLQRKPCACSIRLSWEQRKAVYSIQQSTSSLLSCFRRIYCWVPPLDRHNSRQTTIATRCVNTNLHYEVIPVYFNPIMDKALSQFILEITPYKISLLCSKLYFANFLYVVRKSDRKVVNLYAK